MGRKIKIRNASTGRPPDPIWCNFEKVEVKNAKTPKARCKECSILVSALVQRMRFHWDQKHSRVINNDICDIKIEEEQYFSEDQDFEFLRSPAALTSGKSAETKAEDNGCDNMVYRTVQKMLDFNAKSNGFGKVLEKIKILSAGSGTVTAELKVEEQHTNPFGTMHGGFTATLIDVISSYALLTHPKLIDKLESFPNSGVSVDMHISYIRPAHINDEIIIKADTVKMGRTMAFLDILVSNKTTGAVVAKGTHTKFMA